MADPFAGIITAEMKTTFTQAIDSLLESAACTVPCRLITRGTRFTSCSNCVFDPIGNKSSNRWLNGGAIPFPNGQLCPMCGGVGKIPDENTSTIDLMPIWDARQWVSFGGMVREHTTQTGHDFVQTMSKFATYDELTQATEIIIDTDIEGYVRNRFARVGNPEICGFSASSYIFTMWKRVG